MFSAGPDGDRRPRSTCPGRPSGLGWLPDGRLLVVSMTERAVLRLEPDGALVHHGDLTPWATFHGNDMVVAADGRAYVGNFGFDLEAACAGARGSRPAPRTSMVRVDPDGTSCEAAPDLAFPNGTVIFPDGRTLVVAESSAPASRAFDVGDDGTLSGRRVWAELDGCRPRRHLPRRRGLHLGGQRPGHRVPCGWPRAARSLDRVATAPALLRLHARRAPTAAPSTASPRPGEPGGRSGRGSGPAASSRPGSTVPGAGLP